MDSIQDGDAVIGAGVGEDISFEESLLALKAIKVVLVDPTPKSHEFVQSRASDSLILLKNAIERPGVGPVRMYKNSTCGHVSESTYPEHSSVSSEFHEAEVITIGQLVHDYSPSLIKLDIEGTEYDVLESCLGVRQVCVEFHHRCIGNRTIDDTMRLVQRFTDAGYAIIDNRNHFQEMTLLKLT